MSSRLQAARVRLGLSRAEVGRRLAVSEQTVYRMETGKTEVKDMHYLAFAHIYGVPVSDLKENEVAA